MPQFTEFFGRFIQSNGRPFMGEMTATIATKNDIIGGSFTFSIQDGHVFGRLPYGVEIILKIEEYWTKTVRTDVGILDLNTAIDYAPIEFGDQPLKKDEIPSYIFDGGSLDNSVAIPAYSLDGGSLD